MSTTVIKNSAGFLDGYMAGNIAANESELKHHTDKIIDMLMNISNILPKSIENQVLVDTMCTSIDKFKSTVSALGESADAYNNLGDDFTSLLTQLKSSFGSEQIPTEILSYVRRSIYHFLNIAKTIQDSRVIESGKKIAQKFL